MCRKQILENSIPEMFKILYLIAAATYMYVMTNSLLAVGNIHEMLAGEQRSWYWVYTSYSLLFDKEEYKSVNDYSSSVFTALLSSLLHPEKGHSNSHVRHFQAIQSTAHSTTINHIASSAYMHICHDCCKHLVMVIDSTHWHPLINIAWLQLSPTNRQSHCGHISVHKQLRMYFNLVTECKLVCSLRSNLRYLVPSMKLPHTVLPRVQWGSFITEVVAGVRWTHTCCTNTNLATVKLCS